MADHKSTESRIPDWAIVPFWVSVLLVNAAIAFGFVSWGVHSLNA